MAKKSFIIHVDSLDVLDELTDVQVGQLFRAIKSYHTGDSLELDPLVKIAYIPFKKQFERNDVKYDEICEKRRISGSKGGKQKVANATKSKQKLANLADSDSKSDSDSVSDNKKDSKKKKEKTDADKSAYTNCIDLYNEFIKTKTDVPAKLDGAEGNAMKAIITYLRSALKTDDKSDDAVVKSFKAVLDNYGKWGKFNQQNLKLQQINSNLINIIANIKAMNKKTGATAELKDIDYSQSKL